MFHKTTSWITFDKALQSVSVYKTFVAEKPSAAEIKICGLGFFELYLNGNRVGNDLFTPAWTDYCSFDKSTLTYPSQDETSHRAYYLKYNLQNALVKGNNTLCVVLGNGFYRQTRRVAEGRLVYSEQLRLIFELSYTDGGRRFVVSSDPSCLYSANFIKENNIFYGEKHDYENRLPDYVHIPENARFCEKTEDYPYLMEEQTCPPDCITDIFPCTQVLKKGGMRIFRVPEEISGRAVIRAGKGNVRVTYFGELGADGMPDYNSAGGADQIQEDEFIAPPSGALLFPRFTWHAFRYFSVEGNCDVLRAELIRTNVRRTVEFHCSSPVLNWLFNAYCRTQTNNFHGSVPSDCPHRERLGYTGDGQLAAETAMLFFDADKLYRKWIDDILDCQDKKSGHIQHTAPFYGGGGGPGGWGCAVVVVPYRHYCRYGDAAVLKKSFPNMRKWVESMRGFCENGLVVREYAGGWCLGEWCTPDKPVLPESFVNTYYLIKSLSYMKEICGVLNEDFTPYGALMRESLAAFERAFYDEKNGSFCGGAQGADAFALSLGLGDARTRENLIGKYDKLGAFDTGMFGTEVLCGVLASLNEYELLFKLLASEKYPSFGYEMAAGATTIWEDWKGEGSHDHPMFGASAKYLVTVFAGIDDTKNGVIVAPKTVKGINGLFCSLQSKRGLISVRYEKRGAKICFELESEQNAVFEYGGETHGFSGRFYAEYPINVG